ncbi:hypothetical protein D3C79_608160 [compost metagenome]
MLFDHPGDERPAEVVRHDLHAHLRTTLAGDVVNGMLGDARPGDMAATADAVEQERVVFGPRRQVLAAQVQPRLQLLERPWRGVLDQLAVALAQHLQAARLEVDLVQVDVHRFRLAHAGAVQQGDDRRVTHTLRPWVGRAHIHQFANQAAAQVAPRRQAAAGGRLDLADAQQLLVIDQALAPGFVHHTADGVDVQRRAVGCVTVGTQRRHQGDHMAGLEPMPGHIDDIAVDKTQPVGSVLKDVAHGLLAGWGQAGHVLQQRIFREVGQNVNPVAKRWPAINRPNPEASQYDIQASQNNSRICMSFGPGEVPSP